MFRRFSGLSRIHFVGIGGAGMSGIAEVLAVSEVDLEVSGCDLVAGETTRRLEELGVKVQIGHSKDHVRDADLLVISSAVGEENEDVVAARRLGVPVVRRAEMLAELMRLKYGVAVAGTHGKTTTTSLIGTLLTEGGFDPTVIVGGRLRVTGTGARLGKSDYLVAEADEFDRSFLKLQPILAIVTSIDRDHLDTYADLDDIQEAFVNFREPGAVLRPGDRLPGRSTYSGHPAAPCRSSGGDVRVLPSGGPDRARDADHPARIEVPRPSGRRGRAGRDRDSDAGPPQRAELARRDRGGSRDGSGVQSDRRDPVGFLGRSSPLRAPRRMARSLGGRRLCPPPGRGGGHPQRGT